MGQNQSRECPSQDPEDVQGNTPPDQTFVTGDIHYHSHENHYHDEYPSISFAVEQKYCELRECLKQKIEGIDLKKHQMFPIKVAKQSKDHIEHFGRKWTGESEFEGQLETYDMHDLFNQSQLDATKQANIKYECQASKMEYIMKNGNTVGAVGIAGVGKTTMVKILAKRNQSSTVMDESPIIFFISLRDVNFAQECSVLKFLNSSMLSSWPNSKKMDAKLLKKLSEAKEVFIFLDGLDEASTLSAEELTTKMTLFDTEKPDVILKNLLCGHIFPRAKKFITSRPGAYRKLNSEYCPEFTVTVLGFEKESIEQFCRSVGGNAFYDEVVQPALATNPTISSLSRIPMFCQMIVQYLSRESSSLSSIFSISDLFVFTFLTFIRCTNFHGNVSDIPKLSQLALKAFVFDQHTFSKSEFEEAGISSACVDTFMNMDNTNTNFRILDGENVFYFSHLLWQEFLSALCLVVFATDDSFESCSQSFGKDRWHSVVKFVFGLINPISLAKLQNAFPLIKRINLSQKRRVLYDFLDALLDDYTKHAVQFYPTPLETLNYSHELSTMEYHNSTAHQQLLALVSWVFELNDERLKQNVADKLPKTIHLRGEISSNAMSSLLQLLSNTGISRDICFGTYVVSDYVVFDEESFNQLLVGLRNTAHKLTSLHIKHHVSSVAQLAHYLHDIKEVSFRFSSLTVETMREVFRSIGLRSHPVQSVGFSGNTNLPLAIEDLKGCLPLIGGLEIPECNISETCVEELSKAIKGLKNPMVFLNLSENKIGTRGVQCLTSCLHNIMDLEIANCCLLENDMALLANAIQGLKTPMKRLLVDENKIGADGVAHLSQCISKIEALYIFRCNLEGDDIEMLAERIALLSKPMECLVLGGNLIGSSGAGHLCRCMHKVKRLQIGRCGLIGEDIEMMAEKMLLRNEPIELLNISGNEIGDREANAVARCLPKIKLLVMYYCNLTQHAVENLQSHRSYISENCKIFGLKYQLQE